MMSIREGVGEWGLRICHVFTDSIVFKQYIYCFLRMGSYKCMTPEYTEELQFINIKENIQS